VGTGGIPISWFTLILFVELGRFLGYRITKQEATMIFFLSSAELFIPLGMIYRGYFKTSDIAALFGITDEIPTWYAPDPATKVYELRTFFHPAWSTPFLIYFSELVAVSLAVWGLGFFARRLFIIEENLPFPLQQVSARALITLTEERKKEDISLLFLTATLSFIYGFMAFAFPFILQAYANIRVTIIPLPWIDLTQSVQHLFPGALLGISTDLGAIAGAFVLPIPTIVGIMIGSFAVYFIGNWLSVAYNLAIEPWWYPGMSTQMALQRSILYFWGAPLMGFGMAGGVVPALMRLFLRRKKEPSAKKARFWDPTLLKMFLIPLAGVWALSILWYKLLTPDFPISILLPFVIIIPIILVLIDGRMLGETGLTFAGGQTGNLMRLLYWSSGYQKADIWFVPTPWRAGAAGVLAQLKVCDLTETDIFSFFKMWWIFLPVGIIVGFLFTQLFWWMAPIPSGRYPATEIFWPMSAVNECLWIRGLQRGLFLPEWLFGAFTVGAILAAAFELSGASKVIPFISFVAGTGTVTPYAVTYGIGLAIRLILCKLLGTKWFEERKQMFSAGIMMGYSIAAIVGIAITLIINSIWVLPY
ncbi:MAG: hypothetical protein QXX56_05545, partial [Candidatus Bathyarchaeia archaeon]